MSEKVSLAAAAGAPPADPSPQIPTELVPLPSEGVVYPVDSPLHGQQALEIRSMTAREEDILMSRALLKSGRALSMLLRNCITTPGVDVDRLLSGDRNAALIAIRITGYGPAYDIQITCPSCGNASNATVDLASLPIKRFPEGAAPLQAGTNEFGFLLPASKRRVVFRLMDGAHERELLQTIERRRKEGLGEEIVTTRLKLQVVSIDGVSDTGKVARMIETMPARDSRELRKYIDSISPGVDLRTRFSCGSCDTEDQEVEVPIGTEFFWPQS